MKVKLLPLIFLFISLIGKSQSTDVSSKDLILDKVQDNITKFENYTFSIPVEKVHLHVDRNWYFPGEDIWFKAYLAEGTFHLPDTLSKILYVDLVSPDNNVVMSRKLEIKNSICYGDFKLNDELASGNYFIRGYTNWMRNWGEDNVFTKEISIKNPNKPSNSITWDYAIKPAGNGDSIQLLVQLPNFQMDITEGEKYKYSIFDEDNELVSKGTTIFDVYSYSKLNAYFKEGEMPQSLKLVIENKERELNYSSEIIIENKPILNFYPEGGYLIQGLPSKIAFKLSDKDGKALHAKAELYSSSGRFISKVETIHAGMGEFLLTPLKEQKYHLVVNEKYKFELPEALSEGFVLSTVEKNADEIRASIYCKGQNADRYCTLIGQTRGKIYYSSTVKLKNGFGQLTVPRASFPEGIVQFTLFDQSGKPYCERLVYNRNNTDDLNIRLEPNKKSYAPREKVKLKIKAKDAFGAPVKANLSLAVSDYYQTNSDDLNTSNILSSFYLTSELKGYIKDPEFYLQDDEKNKKALDLLLLSHGWRRFTWQQALENEKFTQDYSIERIFRLTGKLEKSPRRYPITENELLFLYFANGKVNSKLINPKADSTFAFDFKPFYDTSIFAIQTMNKQGYSKDYKLSIDTTVYPDIAMLKALSSGSNNWDEYNDLYKEKEFIDKFYSDTWYEELEEVVVTYSRKVSKLPKDPYLMCTDVKRGIFIEDEKAEHLNVLLYLNRMAGVTVKHVAGRPGLCHVEIAGTRGIFGQTRPEYFVDGIWISPENALDYIATISPQDVYYINVLKPGETGILGSKGSGGAVLIYTRTGSYVYTEEKTQAGLHSFQYPGFYTAREFYSPFYNDRVKNDTKRDIRPTLYWNPNIQTDKNGEATIEFYNSDRITQVDAYIEGMDKTGLIGKSEATYYIE